MDGIIDQYDQIHKTDKNFFLFQRAKSQLHIYWIVEAYLIKQIFKCLVSFDAILSAQHGSHILVHAGIILVWIPQIENLLSFSCSATPKTSSSTFINWINSS